MHFIVDILFHMLDDYYVEISALVSFGNDFDKIQGRIRVKMKKSREDQEEDIISEFIKDLDLSDARVKKRLFMECSRQELFQTAVGKKFMQNLLPEKMKVELLEEKKKYSGWKQHGKKVAVIGSLCTVLFGGILVTFHIMEFKMGKANAMSGVVSDYELDQMRGGEDFGDEKNSETEDLGEDNFEETIKRSNAMENDVLTGQTEYTLKFEEIFAKTKEEKELSGKTTYFSDTYMVQESKNDRIKEEDLNQLSYEQLYIGLYEIYARHGRRFYDVNLQAYFNEKSWYVPIAEDVRFTEDVLNEYERSNIIAIKETMDRYEEENKVTVYDYSSITIDEMRNCLEDIYKIQKNYLYCFTITKYYDGRQDFEQCFQSQKENLSKVLKVDLLNESIDQADDAKIRAMFMNLQEAGYLMDGELVLNNMGAL